MIGSILEFREKLKALYARFDMIVDVVVKFVIAFVSLKLMMDNIGFFQTMKNPFILLMVSLACSILPYGITAFILAVLVLLNVYKVCLKNDYALNRKAFLASKKVGNSVVRHRAVRLMKEAFRQIEKEKVIPQGYDLLFIARNTIIDSKCADVKNQKLNLKNNS